MEGWQWDRKSGAPSGSTEWTINRAPFKAPVALVSSTNPAVRRQGRIPRRPSRKVILPAAALSILIVFGLFGPAVLHLPGAPFPGATSNAASSYVVTFREAGLANSTTWSVSINSVVFTTNTSVIKASAPVGTQDYIVSVPASYSGPRYGNFTVVNAPINVTLDYHYNCPVLIRESGLPSGALWWANVTNGSGYRSYFSRGPTVNWTAFPGSYQYSVGTSSTGYGPANLSNQFVLGPSGYRGNVSFRQAVYRMNFTAVGLATGSAWVLNLTDPNGTVVRNTITVPTLSVFGPGGTYLFAASAVGYTVTPGFGAVIAGPQNTSQAFLFRPARASVAFAESGLPMGNRWWVNLTAANESRLSGTSTGSWVNFSLPAGTFSFTVGAGGFSPTPASGSFTLTALGYGRAIVFVSTTPGRLELEVRPRQADLTIGGQRVNLSTNGTVALPLAPGVYPIVALATGFAPYFTNVSIRSGATQNLTIGMTALPAAPASTPFNYIGPLGTILIGVLLATAVALSVALVMAWRRRPPSTPAEDPPEMDVDEDLSETWLTETDDLPP